MPSGSVTPSSSGSSGYPSGTSFPASPSTNTVFYRTDLELLFFFDGTRWLSLSQYRQSLLQLINNAAAFGNLATYVGVPQTLDMWLERFSASSIVTTTNNGTNFWTVTLNKVSTANVNTALGSLNTSADTVTTWTPHTVAIGVALTAATNPALGLTSAVTGAPGNISGEWEAVYRLIGV